MSNEPPMREEPPTQGSILFVDGNYEVYNRWQESHPSSDPTGLAPKLERSLKLCTILTENMVLHAGPHFFEHPLMPALVLKYHGFFRDERAAFTTKAGVDFERLVRQREGLRYQRYPHHLVIRYSNVELQSAAQKFPRPLDVRTASMTAGIRARLRDELHETERPGMLGTQLLWAAKSSGDPTAYGQWRDWLEGFTTRQASNQEPMLFDVLVETQEAPSDPFVRDIVRRKLITLYFAEAETAYHSYACTIFRRTYPPEWRSAKFAYYNLLRLWDVLAAIGTQTDVEGFGEHELAQYLYGDNSPVGLFLTWYKDMCLSSMPFAKILAQFARAARAGSKVHHHGIDMGQVVADLRGWTAAIARRPAVSRIVTGSAMKRTHMGQDIGIIIALSEEFTEFHKQLQSAESERDPDTGTSDYFFGPPVARAKPPTCVATFIGDMGLEEAALATDRFIQRRNPHVVVMLGVAAGIDDDVQLGDVVVGTHVGRYLDRAKAVPGKGGTFELKHGGTSFPTSAHLVQALRHFVFQPDGALRSWQDDRMKQRQGYIAVEVIAALEAKGQLRDRPRLIDGKIASGPVVGAATEFVRWLKGINRTYVALEMEGGGVLAAIHSRTIRREAVILRGISDFGDERKKELDQIDKGGLRRMAMNNTIALLWKAVEHGVLSSGEW